MQPESEFSNGPSIVIADSSFAVCRYCGGQINQAPQTAKVGIERNRLSNAPGTAVVRAFKKQYSAPTITVLGKFVFVKD